MGFHTIKSILKTIKEYTLNDFEDIEFPYYKVYFKVIQQEKKVIEMDSFHTIKSILKAGNFSVFLGNNCCNCLKNGVVIVRL